jgi:ubiquinone biosynthesis protein
MTAIERILAPTDRSPAADRAVEWAADLAARYDASLLIVQVIAPESLVGEGEAAAATAEPDLIEFAARIAGSRAQTRIVFDSDAAAAIVRIASSEQIDLLVVSNTGMSSRGEFLLGNVPNRISHGAPCSVILVDAGDSRASREAGSRAQSDTHDGYEPQGGQLLGRAAVIGRVLLRFAVRELRQGRSPRSPEQRARNLREALERLGPTFSKLGQILSTRPDLLPPAFSEELARLQDRVPPLSESEVVSLMEAEFKVPWEDVFQRIEPEPMAAGTIAQVHRAVLANGDRVVVKVQRPGAEALIMQDVGLLELFAQKAAGRPSLTEVADLPAIIDYLAASLRRELDFRVEAANIERMRAVLQQFSRLEVPRIYDEISTARLLVMQEVQGTPVLEAPPGPARKEAAEQLLESYYQQVLSDGFFHADPHPGNLLWWKDTIYFLDFGMVGELDAEIRNRLMLALLAFSQEDAEFLTEVLISLAEQQPGSALDQEALRLDLAELIADYRQLKLEELRLGPLMQRLTQIAARHHLRMPASLALAAKAFGQMQMIATTLDPTLDPFAVASRFFRRRIFAEARRLAAPKQLLLEAQKLKLRLTNLVEGLERLTGARPGPGLRIDLGGVDRLERSVRRASNLLALGLLAATAGLLATAFAVGLGPLSRGPLLVLGAVGAVLLAASARNLLRR